MVNPTTGDFWVEWQRLEQIETELALVKAELQALKSTDGIKKITDAVDVSDREARELGKVQLSGSIVADHFASRTGDISPATSNEEVTTPIEKEVILHQITAEFSTAADNLFIRFHMYDGDGGWEEYKVPADVNTLTARINTVNAKYDPMFTVQTEGERNILTFNGPRRFSGIRITANNFHGSETRQMAVTVAWSEV